MVFGGKKDNDAKTDGPGLKIRLEYDNTPLYELHTLEYAKEIVIGRSPECDWHLDEVDNSLSAKHAVITRRRKNFYLSDLQSRNGIYFHNKKIQEKELKAGDRISLGACVLVVDEEEHAVLKAKRFSRLVYLTEQGKKMTVDISKQKMVIGSASDCDIVLENQLVSSHHAEVELHGDGSCWIRDLRSRNGTIVNGAELEIDGERMLQDNDTISIAYIDMTFQDAAVEHTESHLWTYVTTIAVTVLLCLSAYVAYLAIMPNAERLMASVEYLLGEGELTEAENVLGKVEFAKGGKNYNEEVTKKRAQISKWWSVMREWEATKEILAENKLTEALRSLSSLVEGADPDSWSWLYADCEQNASGEAVKRIINGEGEKRKAKQIYDLLALNSKADALLSNPNSSLEEIGSCRAELKSLLARARDLPVRGLENVVDYSEKTIARMEKIQNEETELRNALALLDPNRYSSPDYSAVLLKLDKLGDQSSGLVKARANRYRSPVRSLRDNTEKLAQMNARICELKFDNLGEFAFDGTGCDFNVDINITTQKEQLQRKMAEFRRQAQTVYNDSRQLLECNVSPETLPEEHLEFLDEEKLQKIFAFDCLDYDPPRQQRRADELENVYDRMLGIEFFFEYLRSFSTKSQNYQAKAHDPFEPVIVRYRQILGYAETFVEFARHDENQWFGRGRLKQLIDQCEKMLAERDRLVEKLLSWKAADGTELPVDDRVFLLSRGMAMYLLGTQTTMDAADKMQGLLEQAMKVYVKKMRDLDYKFMHPSIPSETLQTRVEIFDAALPGDSVLKNRVWKVGMSRRKAAEIAREAMENE